MRRRPRKSKILTQFLLFIVPFAVLAVSLTSAALTWTSYRQFQNTIARDYENIMSASAGEIRLFMQYARQRLETLAWVMATKTHDPYAQQLALGAFNQINGDFSHVSLVRPDGHTIATTQWKAEQPLALDKYLMDKALAGQWTFSEVWFAQDQFPHVSLVVPAPPFSNTGHILWGSLDLKTVWDVLDGISIGESGYVYIMDTKGRYIAHPQIDQVLRAAPPIAADVLKTIRHAERPVAWIESEGDFKLYCLGVHLPELDWIVTLRQPTHEIYHFLSRTLLWAALITVAVCLFAVAFGWRWVHHTLRPIHAMHRQVRQIGAGNWDRAVTVTANNEIGELGIAFNEMTDALKQMVRREIEMAEELAHAKNLAVLGVTASTVTHEVGNLLNNVDMCAHVLKSGTRQPSGQRALANLEKESARVKSFIQDFLKFAKPPKVNPVPMALYPIIREVMAMYTPTAKTRGIELELDWPPGMPDVLADTRHIYQVFNNLIKNSTEAVEGGGRIRVEAERSDGYLRVTVADDGAGIDPDHAERIFEPFFTTKGKMGYGLGMAIVKSILTAHRGTITCCSQPGEGTQMIIDLPVG